MRFPTGLLLGLLILTAVTPITGDCQPGAAAVFKARCARCHGASGNADTPWGRVLKVAPLRNDARLARMPTAQIMALIKSDPKHRGVVDIDDGDLKAAALFVKRLARRGGP